VAGAQRFPLEAAEETWNKLHQPKKRNFTSSSTSYPQAKSKPPGGSSNTWHATRKTTRRTQPRNRSVISKLAAEIERGKGVPHEDVLRDFGM
jgi:hypothetical protein